MKGDTEAFPRCWEWSDAWANESQYLTWLRGQLRQIWSDYPVRTEFKDEMCVTVSPAMREAYGLHKQTKKAAMCVFCKKWFAKSHLETDHITGNKSMKSVTEILDYLKHLQCSKQEMQLTCKPCHKIKSYSESSGLSFEEARVEKSVILWLKEHTVAEQKDILTLAGFDDDKLSNEKGRRACARALLANV